MPRTSSSSGSSTAGSPLPTKSNSRPETTTQKNPDATKNSLSNAHNPQNGTGKALPKGPLGSKQDPPALKTSSILPVNSFVLANKESTTSKPFESKFQGPPNPTQHGRQFSFTFGPISTTSPAASTVNTPAVVPGNSTDEVPVKTSTSPSSPPKGLFFHGSNKSPAPTCLAMTGTPVDKAELEWDTARSAMKLKSGELQRLREATKRAEEAYSEAKTEEEIKFKKYVEERRRVEES